MLLLSAYLANLGSKMKTVCKRTCLILAELLHAYGVRHVVVSPGTRCAPVVTALHRRGLYVMMSVIDERSAAFVALGMASRMGEPVALVCTSGSAMLNYGSALAEAYYRNIPLIAITADRPAEWIDQLDGQTIRQHGALPNVFRKSVDIPVENGTDEQLFYINRLMNDALQAAVGSPSGPVQINVQLSAPLVELQDAPAVTRGYKIEVIRPSTFVSQSELFGALGDPAVIGRMLIVVGGMHPSVRMKECLTEISGHGVVILSEVQSNLCFPNPAFFEDSLGDVPVPDVVIAMGGAIVSAKLKSWLRQLPQNIRFVCVGEYDSIVDTYLHNAVQLRVDEESFCHSFSAALGSFSLAPVFKTDFLTCAKMPVPDETSEMLKSVLGHASGFDLHFGNGMSIRYAQALAPETSGQIDCNRGVNGIDGSTSTAIGSAMVSPRTTLLIIGDMSAAYDIWALATADIPTRFKMAVLNNGGGDIFRRIPTTGPLPERERFFAVPPRLPLRQLAEAYGFAYFEASHPGDESIRRFAEEKDRPAIINLKLRPYDNGK